MDESTIFDNNSIWILEQIIQPLYTVTNDGKGVMPWLATGYKMSADKKTYTLTLRPGVKFSNGQPMTSADVKFSLEQTMAATAGLGLHRRGHRVGGRTRPVDCGRPPEVPVGSAPGRPVPVRQRHRAQQLRRQDRRAVLPGPDRHRARSSGTTGTRASALKLVAQHLLLAEGPAVPGQRDLDRRAERQHQAAADQGRPGADRPVPVLVDGRRRSSPRRA